MEVECGAPMKECTNKNNKEERMRKKLERDVEK